MQEGERPHARVLPQASGVSRRGRTGRRPRRDRRWPRPRRSAARRQCWRRCWSTLRSTRCSRPAARAMCLPSARRSPRASRTLVPILDLGGDGWNERSLSSRSRSRSPTIPTLGVEDFMVSLYNGRTVPRVLIAGPDGSAPRCACRRLRPRCARSQPELDGSSRDFLELDQRAVEILGMKEQHRQAHGRRASACHRRGRARRPHVSRSAASARSGTSKQMWCMPPAGWSVDEFRDRRVGAERHHQLDLGIVEGNEHHRHAVLRQQPAALRPLRRAGRDISLPPHRGPAPRSRRD